MSEPLNKTKQAIVDVLATIIVVVWHVFGFLLAVSLVTLLVWTAWHTSAWVFGLLNSWAGVA